MGIDFLNLKGNRGFLENEKEKIYNWRHSCKL